LMYAKISCAFLNMKYSDFSSDRCETLGSEALRDALTLDPLGKKGIIAVLHPCYITLG
jgi:hypothetical protein